MRENNEEIEIMVTLNKTYVEIVEAEYLGDYKVKLLFNDNTSQNINFYDFLSKAKNPMTAKYRDKELFRKFKVEYGDLIWGDYEMCFPIDDLYKGML